MNGPFLCEFCSELLASPKCLERHLKTHEVKDYQFLCYTCNKPFKNSDQLKHHERTHKIVKLITCKYCPLKFRNRGSLALHMESSHAWMKPFHCEKCDIGYSLSMEYNAHVASHDVESLLMCPLCYRCFSQPLNLSLHLKKKHDIREIFRTKGVSSQTHAFLDCEWPFLKFIERIDSKDHYVYHAASKYVFISNFSVKSLAHLLMEKYQFLRECMIKTGKTPKRQSYVKRKRRKIKPAETTVVKKPESFRCKIKKLFSTYSVAPLLKKARRLKRYFKEIRKEIRNIQSKSGLPNSQPLTRKLLSENLAPKTSTLSSFVGLIPHNDLVQVAMPSGDNRVVPCIVRVLPQSKAVMKVPPPSLERIIAPKPQQIVPEKSDGKLVVGHVSMPCLVRASQVVEKSNRNKPNQFSMTKKPIGNPKQGRTSPPLYARRPLPNILSRPRPLGPNTPAIPHFLTQNPQLPAFWQQRPQAAASWQQHPQYSAAWQQRPEGSTSWQHSPQGLGTSAFKLNFQNVMFPDRNRVNTKFPIPTLNAESLAALSTCSYEDLSKFVEEFSVLLVNKYFLSIFNPVQFPTYFIGNPPPTLCQLPQPVMRDLIVKQVDGQLIRRRIAEEVCRKITPSPINIPSSSSATSSHGNSSTSSTIRSGTTHQPYTLTWTQPRQQSLLKTVLNPASPTSYSTTSGTPSLKPYSIIASNIGNPSEVASLHSGINAFSGAMLPSTSTQIYSPRPPNINRFGLFTTTTTPSIVHVEKSLSASMNLAIRQPIKGHKFIPSTSYMPIVVKVKNLNKYSGLSYIPKRVEHIENVSGKNFRLFEIRVVVPKLRIPKEDCLFRVISGGIAVKRLFRKDDDDDDDSNDGYGEWSPACPNQIVTKKSLSSVENLKSGFVKKIPGGFAVRTSPIKTNAQNNANINSLLPGFVKKIPGGYVVRTSPIKSIAQYNAKYNFSRVMTLECDTVKRGRPPKTATKKSLESVPAKRGRPPKTKSQASTSQAGEKPKDVNKNKSLRVKRKDDLQEAVPVKNIHYPIRSRSSSVQVDIDDSASSNDKTKTSFDDSTPIESDYKYPLRNKPGSLKKVEVSSPQPPKKKFKAVAKVEKEESSEEEYILDSQSGILKKMGRTSKSSNSKGKVSQEGKIGMDVQDLEILYDDFQEKRLTRSRVMKRSTAEVTKTSETKSSKLSTKHLPDVEPRSLKNCDTKPIGVGEKPDQLQLDLVSNCSSSNSSGSNVKTSKNTAKSKSLINSERELNFKNSLSLKSAKPSHSKTTKKNSKTSPTKLRNPTQPQSIKLWLPSDPEQASEILEQCGFELSDLHSYKSKAPTRKIPTRQSKINKVKVSRCNSDSEGSADDLPLDLTRNKKLFASTESKVSLISRSKKRSSTETLDDESQAKTIKSEPQDQRQSTRKDFRDILHKQLRKTNNSSQMDFPDYSNSSVNTPTVEEILDEPSTSRRGLRKDSLRSPAKLTITNELRKTKIKSKRFETIPPISTKEAKPSRNSSRKLRNQPASVPDTPKTLKTSPQKPQKQNKYEPLIIDVKTHIDTSSGNLISKDLIEFEAKTLSDKSLSPTETFSVIAPKRLRSWNLCKRK